MLNYDPLKLLLPCPECGSDAIAWCNISVRPHCTDCGTWGRLNLGTAADAIAAWNKASQTRDTKADHKRAVKALVQAAREAALILRALESTDATGLFKSQREALTNAVNAVEAAAC